MTNPRQPADTVLEELRIQARLAWPVVVGQLGLMTMGLADVIMIGRLGGEAQAAVALGNTWSFAGLIVLIGAASGLDPLLAQAFGGGRRHDALRSFLQGAALLGLLCAPVWGMHGLAEPGLAALGQPAEVIGDADAYVRIVGVSVVPIAVFSLLRQYLQAMGWMRPAMWVILVGNLVNLVANYVLIFGNFGLPPLGVVGCAWSTVLARAGMALLLVLPALGGLLELPRVRGVARGFPHAVGTALPVAVQLGLEVWAFNTSTLLAGWFGASLLAAHQAALSTGSVMYMIPLGIGAAAATRVGNLLGAGRRWRLAARVAVGSGAAVMLASAGAIVLTRSWIARAFTPDPEVIPWILALLPVLACFQLFDGIQVVSFGVLRGAGDTRWPALANVLGYWMVGLPVAYLLAFHTEVGPPGIWWGLTVALAIVAGTLTLRVAALLRRDEPDLRSPLVLALVGGAGLIALADLAQPVFLDWRPKFVGAVVGAVIYGTVAVGVWREVRLMAWVAAGMPLIPATTLVLWGLGVPLPAQPDGPMIGIFVLQILVALLAAVWLLQRARTDVKGESTRRGEA